MSPQELQILKHPNYVSSARALAANPYYRRKPRLSEITFTKVLHTTVCCTHCNGTKKQYTVFGDHVLQEKCAICNGSGTMEIDNRPENFAKEPENNSAFTKPGGMRF